MAADGMTPRYSLFGSPDSANLVVRLLLHELNVPFETVWLDRAKREHKQADYLALNPQGLIPVLVDNGQPIFETAAILLHLCDRHGALAPRDGVERARFLQWLVYLSNTPHADLRACFNADDYVDGAVAEAALLAGMCRRFAGHLRLIEAELASTPQGPWFLGDALSVLDLYLAALCRWYQLYPSPSATARIDAETLPFVHRLLEALAARPAVVSACAEEHIVAPYFVSPVLPDLPVDQVTG
ncbi:MAG: glutathione S-transferase family protein [Pseudomonadota bacterium]